MCTEVMLPIPGCSRRLSNRMLNKIGNMGIEKYLVEAYVASPRIGRYLDKHELFLFAAKVLYVQPDQESRSVIFIARMLSSRLYCSVRYTVHERPFG